MARRLYYAKKYQIEWELPQQLSLSEEEWNDIFKLSEEEEEQQWDDGEFEYWNSESESHYEFPKVLLEKRIKQYENSNKTLSEFCKEILNNSDRTLDYVRIEFF